MHPPIVIVAAPSILGLRPTGVERMPSVLLAGGLRERVGAERVVHVDVPPYESARDRYHGLRNVSGIGTFTRRLADLVEAALDGSFPLVLGGDCSILLGNLLALRRRGRHGLLFLDGHADFYQPEANVNGEVASSELALATGRGPDALTRFEGHARMVRDEDVVLIGQRDAAEAASYGSLPLPPNMTNLDLAAVRSAGVDLIMERALERLLRPVLDGFWIHLDVDVLDDRIMPAVDYRMPGGLSWQELEAIVGAAVRTGRCRGMDVTIYNPTLDEDGHIARDLVEVLGAALA